MGDRQYPTYMTANHKTPMDFEDLLFLMMSVKTTIRQPSPTHSPPYWSSSHEWEPFVCFCSCFFNLFLVCPKGDQTSYVVPIPQAALGYVATILLSSKRWPHVRTKHARFSWEIVNDTTQNHKSTIYNSLWVLSTAAERAAWNWRL